MVRLKRREIVSRFAAREDEPAPRVGAGLPLVQREATKFNKALASNLRGHLEGRIQVATVMACTAVDVLQGFGANGRHFCISAIR